ncbi:MAG: EamA family transporter [Candidatus Eisenbacteria bacterium]|nr:EamA family transporter [Candidatus Eisenbacteria bacterium]
MLSSPEAHTKRALRPATPRWSARTHGEGDDVPDIMLGQLLSLLSALLWAFSVVLFRMSGRSMTPVGLNLFKSAVALLLLVPTLYFFGGGYAPGGHVLDILILFLAGAVGIAVADTVFFQGLNLVGAGLSQIASCSYSPFVILMSFFALGERITPGDGLGAVLILSGIFISARHDPPRGVGPSELRKGIILCTIAMALNALGVVIGKPVLNRTPVLWATTARLAGGVLTLALIALFVPRLRNAWRAFVPHRSWRIALPASVIGTYLTMLVWIAGMKFAPVSIASILNQTSAIFVLPVAALMLREPITPRKLIAVGLALGGVALVTLA